ncbi:unnamed protein product, partial [Ceratitis capitata]
MLCIRSSRRLVVYPVFLPGKVSCLLHSNPIHHCSECKRDTKSNLRTGGSKL